MFPTSTMTYPKKVRKKLVINLNRLVPLTKQRFQHLALVPFVSPEVSLPVA